MATAFRTLTKVCDRRNCITSQRRLEEKTMRIATLAVVAALGAAAFAGAAAAQPAAATPSYPAAASDYDYSYRFGLPPNAFAGCVRQAHIGTRAGTIAGRYGSRAIAARAESDGAEAARTAPPRPLRGHRLCSRPFYLAGGDGGAVKACIARFFKRSHDQGGKPSG